MIEIARPAHDHSVQFYESDAFLAGVVSSFLAAGLQGADVALVIATAAHRTLFCDRLAALGIDVPTLIDNRRLVILDADDAVKCIATGDDANEERFHAFVGPSLREVAASAGAGNVRAYGEIVDLLWRAGKRAAAIRVEELWNDLHSRHDFSLLCAYVMDSFVKHHGIREVCATHTHVHAPEARTDGRIDVLDAQALVNEIAHRRQLEIALRESMAQLRAAEEQARAAKEELEDFFAGAVVPIHRVDRDGIIRWANTAELTLLGFEADEYIGRPIADFHWDKCAIAEILARLTRGDTLHDAKSTLIAKDGTLRYVEISSNVQLRDGEFLGTRCFTRDVTSLRLAEHRAEVLRRLSGALASALGVEDVANVVITEAREVLGASVGTLLLLDGSGTSVERIVTKDTVMTSMYEDLRIEASLPLTDAARTAKLIWIVGPEAIEARYPSLEEPRKQSDARTWGAVPMIFEDRPIGSIAFRCDRERPLSTDEEQLLLAIGRQAAQAIERARLHDATEAERAAAERANRAKDEFLAMLGHELRNPLSPILTAVQLMKLRGDGACVKEQEVIERQAKHLTRLVDDLLDVSRVTRGKVQLDKSPVKLASAVRRALEIVGPQCEERGLHIALSLPKAVVWLDADETRLTQILTNLLSNAAKYTPASGNIEVTAATTGSRVRIAVADNGAGIAPELLPRVFDLFVQGHQASDRKQGGLGIGLAIVRQLVAMHGGEVHAHSAGVGHGSEFVVELPVLELKRAPTKAQRKLSERIKVTPRRILVVDDNEDAASMLGDALRSVGHEVFVANDGPGALELTDRFIPEVAILDLGLPVMDGFALASALRLRFAQSAIRFLAVTGYGQDQDHARTRAAGFEAHFTKPVPLAKILAAIERTPSDRPD